MRPALRARVNFEDSMTVINRYSFLAVLLVLTSTAAELRAQDGPRTAVRFLAGVSAASLADASSSTDRLYGLAIGAQYVVPVRGHWALVPEVLLAEKGGAESDGGSSLEADIRSLDLSLLARWSGALSEHGRQVFAFAGPTAGYLLSCEGSAGAGAVTFPTKCLSSLNRTDFGVTIGAGIEFPTSAIDWGVSLRYQHGLGDIVKAAGEVHTRTVLLLLSYRY
jgi:hypothetical protein